jgi:DNA polymerase-3 subunit epsilon
LSPLSDDARFLDCPLAVVDVETTGFDPNGDRIIEVAVIHMQGGAVTDRWGTLVNPERDVPEDVVRITGIDPAALPGAPRFAEIADEVASRLAGRVFVAYNLTFDRGFIAAELARAGHVFPADRFLDPLVFVRELHRGGGSKKLGAVAERLGISLANAHRATDDAEAAGHILYRLAESLPPKLGAMLLLQQQWEQQQKNEMAGWRGDRGASASIGGQVERGNALGPAYLYGDDTDPVRAMFRHLPDSGGARKAG